MKDYCLELASKQKDTSSKFNIMREYLQAYILKVMHEVGLFRTTAFLGGTALRFLYGLPRFSEDLDFSLIKKGKYKFVELIKNIKDELALAGYAVNVTYNEEKTVYSAFIKFVGLMYEAGISPLKEQKLSIKIEIDTNPPAGAVLKIDIINKYFPISFLSYDLSSLFSGKLHALLSRKYTKGRDFFDLGWYLSKWKDLEPNVNFLNNALKQTNWQGQSFSKDNWKKVVSKVVKEVDWNKVKKDTERFLENPSDVKVFNNENILILLERRD